jgi:hypothetical protein
MLFTEELQKWEVRMRTWEAASFNKHMALHPPNEQNHAVAVRPNQFEQSVANHRLRVTPPLWHPCLRRDRWFDLSERIKDYVPQAIVHQDAIFSVDEPAVWIALAPVIELANHFLTASAWTSFLDALVWGNPQQWTEAGGEFSKWPLMLFN